TNCDLGKALMIVDCQAPSTAQTASPLGVSKRIAMSTMGSLSDLARLSTAMLFFLDVFGMRFLSQPRLDFCSFCFTLVGTWSSKRVSSSSSVKAWPIDVSCVDFIVGALNS